MSGIIEMIQRSALLRFVGVAALPVSVGVLAATGNEVVLVILLVALTAILFEWKPKVMEGIAEKLLIEGAVQTSQQASIAAQHMDERFTEAEATEAALQCGSLQSARAYLGTTCGVCSVRVPISQLVSMVMCQHSICQTCGKDHFTRKIALGNKYDCGCPVCGQPEIADEDQAFNYFSSMDRLFKNLLDAEVYDDLQDMLVNGDQSRRGSNQNDVSIFETCPGCDKIFTQERLVPLLSCEHELCGECVAAHFREKLSSGSLKDCVCPVCKMPDLDHEADPVVYFQKLYGFLESVLDKSDLANYQQMLNHYEEVQKEVVLCRSQNIELTFDQMELALELVEQGFDRGHCLRAARECSDMAYALKYLQRRCPICYDTYPAHEMVSMLACTHDCCVTCAKAYFTLRAAEEPVTSLVCPVCNEPDMTGAAVEDTSEYYGRMQTLLRHLLDPLAYDVFDRRIRDLALSQTPNFVWCCRCQFGFLVAEDAFRVDCTNCNTSMCRRCKLQWAKQHEGISCESFARWIEENDPDNQAAALANYLRDNSIDCPGCGHRFQLARGGCCHYTCIVCKHEFCFYCKQPYSRRFISCSVNHDRNCGSQLVHTDNRVLQRFLTQNNVTFRTELPPGQPQSTRCPVPLTNSSWRESICDREIHEGQTGLCGLHYREYLIKLIGENNLDIAPIL